MKLIDPTAKTNWKFIAIVVAVGFVISGGLFLLISLNSKKTQSAIDIFNQSGQPLQSVILKQGNKTQVVIPKSTTQQNPNSILTHDNSPCAFESLAYDYYLDTYIVKKGDTLLSISKSQSGNTSRVNELIQLNQEKYPSLSIANPFIEIGWQLFLPPKFQESSTGKLFCLKGRIVDQNQSAFQIGTSSSMPVGSVGLLTFKRDTTKYFGKDKFEIGDCVTIVFDDHSIVLAISSQDKNYFKELQEIDTSDWQTYRNDEFGFEVKYPSSWYVDVEDFTTIASIERVRWLHGVGLPPEGNAWVTFFPISPSDLYLQGKEEIGIGYQGGPPIFISETTILQEKQYVIGVSKNYWKDDPRISEYEAIFKQILSTFRFAPTP